MARSQQTVSIDDVGHITLGVAVLLGLHVQHELRQRAVQAGHLALEHGKAAARQLGSGVKIQAQRGAHRAVVGAARQLDGAAALVAHPVARLAVPQAAAAALERDGEARRGRGRGGAPGHYC